MIIKPKCRGFICTTAHPVGCGENVKAGVHYAKQHPLASVPKNILVLGASTGYGQAVRIAATFSGNANTVGVFYEQPPSKKRTGTAGYYNNFAFEKLAKKEGSHHGSINGDAFSGEIKEETLEKVKSILGGKVDLVVYSLAAPKRKDPQGTVFSSVIKPIGEAYTSKTVDFHTGEVSEISLSPATLQEEEDTVKVMGGEDWKLWMEALLEAGVLGENCVTVAFSYLGPELTHPIYKDGTIGKAKEDVEKKATEISTLLEPIQGHAYVCVNKALVTQASSAIPVVPLYISLLYKEMTQKGTHENALMQGIRLFEKLYQDTDGKPENVATDEKGRIRLDDWEMEVDIQEKIATLWEKVSTQNVYELSHLEEYRKEFFQLFGFQVPHVDYTQEISMEDYSE